MKPKLSDNLSDTLIENGIIETEEKQVYAYGLRALSMWAMGTAALFIIGIALGEWVFSIMYFLVFTILRAFYAGIHLKSRAGCLFASTILFLICVWIKRYAIGDSVSLFFGVGIMAMGIVMSTIRIGEFEKLKRTPETEDISFERKKLISGIIIIVLLLAVWLMMRGFYFSEGCTSIFLVFCCNFILYLGNIVCKRFG